MDEPGLLSDYNYYTFVPDKFGQWLNFEESPPLGRKAPDFPLWALDATKISLGELWARHTYTVIEFGSFT